MSLPESCYAWRYKLIYQWKEHIKYFEYLYLKYMFKEPEISDNARTIVGLLKKEIEGLKLRPVHEEPSKTINYP